MQKLKIMLFRVDADVDYKLTASKGISSILSALRKIFEVKEIWMVQKGGSYSRQYSDTVDEYNIHSFRDGKEVVGTLKPDLIMLGGDYEYFARSLLKAGSALGVPTVILVAAFPFWVEQSAEINAMVSGRMNTLRSKGRNIVIRYLFLLRTLMRCRYSLPYIVKTIIKDAYMPFTSYEPSYKFGGGDLNIVNSREWIGILMKNGIDRTKIAVAGDWGMDLIYEKIHAMKKSRSESSPITRILFITTAMVEHGFWKPSMREIVVTSVIRAMKQLGNVSLRIKIHPASENIDDYRKIIDPIDPDIEIIQRIELLPLINESDVIVTFGESWALFEALLLNKPILVMNFFDEDVSRNPFIKEQVVLECKSIRELLCYLNDRRDFQPNPERLASFLEKSIYKFDGKCGERAAAHIVSLLEKGKKTVN